MMDRSIFARGPSFGGTSIRGLFFNDSSFKALPLEDLLFRPFENLLFVIFEDLAYWPYENICLAEPPLEDLLGGPCNKQYYALCLLSRTFSLNIFRLRTFP